MSLVCAGLAAATLALSPQGDTVQGIATVGTTRVALSDGMAVGYKAPKRSADLRRAVVGGRNDTFSVGTEEYVLQVKSRSPRLVGTLKTKAPAIDLGGGRSAGLDAYFDMAVTSR